MPAGASTRGEGVLGRSTRDHRRLRSDPPQRGVTLFGNGSGSHSLDEVEALEHHHVGKMLRLKDDGTALAGQLVNAREAWRQAGQLHLRPSQRRRPVRSTPTRASRGRPRSGLMAGDEKLTFSRWSAATGRPLVSMGRNCNTGRCSGFRFSRFCVSGHGQTGWRTLWGAFISACRAPGTPPATVSSRAEHKNPSARARSHHASSSFVLVCLVSRRRRRSVGEPLLDPPGVKL